MKQMFPDESLPMVNRHPLDSVPSKVAAPLPFSSAARTGLLPSVVIYEPNAKLINYLRRTLSGAYKLHWYSEPEALHKALSGQSADIYVLSWETAEQSLGILEAVCAQHPRVPVVLLSCSSEAAEHELFSRLGVTSVVMKPFTAQSMQAALVKSLATVNVAEEGGLKEVPLDSGHSFVCVNKRMREIERQARLVARADIPVLILGESGTGKEVIALLTHQMSRRCERMFLKINCAAMPAELLESELFGYEQGAFTGALKTKPGKFEICDGGTIFLDEIGEMPAILQAKLLQVLQDGTFSRLGSRNPMRTDVRIIAATNINMKEAIARKTFREDLYYRLNGLSLLLPPLRERLDEIPALTAYFLRKGSERYGLKELRISPFLLAALGRYHWPGNLRELENLINKLLILRDERVIMTELHMEPLPQREAEAPEAKGFAGKDGNLKRMVRGIKGEAESAAISHALEQTGWNRKAAADALHISYKALLYKIKQYELRPEASKADPGEGNEADLAFR